jgi:sulfur relay (sulfurtransferase) DsrF/TusC family protein
LANSASWLIVIASAPYQHRLDSDPAVDLVMAAGAFGQQVSVLFMGEGRGYLDAEITPGDEQTDLRKLLKSLPLYDVDDVYVLADEDADTKAAFTVPAEIIASDDASRLIAHADHVVSF